MVDNNNGTAILVLSDLHVNSTTAICPKNGINLDDGGTYLPSPRQKILIKLWDKFINDVKYIVKGYKLYVIFNGDVGELDIKKRSIQLITLNKSNILRMIYNTVEELIILADGVAVIRGTAAHSGKSSWLEEEFARDLDENLLIKSSDEIYSHYHFKYIFNGVRFDISHHGRMGQLRHTHKFYAIRLAQETMDKYRDKNEPLPDVVIRSHNHRRADSGMNWPVFAMFTPSWQLPNEYIYRNSNENNFIDIGADIFLCNTLKPTTIPSGPCVVYDKFIWYPLKYSSDKLGGWSLVKNK